MFLFDKPRTEVFEKSNLQKIVQTQIWCLWHGNSANQLLLIIWTWSQSPIGPKKSERSRRNHVPEGQSVTMWRQIWVATFMHTNSHQFFNCSWQFIDTYWWGLTGKAAKWAVCRQKFHQKVGQWAIEASVAAAKIDVFAKNGYNKCNKFRKIMKIIT